MMRRLPMGAIRAYDDARYWSREILRNGLRDDHGLGTNEPLTPGQRRDVETVVRAINRIIDRDRPER